MKPLAYSEDVEQKLLQLQKDQSILQSEIKQLSQSLIELRKAILQQRKGPLSRQLVESVSGVIGLKEIIINTNPIIKGVWIVLFVVAAASTLFFTSKTLDEYLQEPTMTKVELAPATTYSFPPVALCPVAWLDAEKAASSGLSHDALVYSLGYRTASQPSLRAENLSRAEADFLDFYDSRNFTSLLEFYSQMSIDLETVYFGKDFSKSQFAVRLGDIESTFLKKTFINSEICWLYSLAPADNTFSAKMTAAAKLVDKTKGFVGLTSAWWFYLAVEPDLMCSVLPGVYLPAYTRSKILITAERFVSMDQDAKHCVPSEMVDESYSPSACTAACQNGMYQEAFTCKIFRFSLASVADHPRENCNMSSRYGSDNMTLSDFRYTNESTKLKARVNEACLERCPQKCDRIVYHASLQWQQVIEKSKDKAANLSDSYIEISVDHTSMYDGGMFTMKEVRSYSFTQLVDNVGGTLGLFVGSTIMTFVQVIMFFVSRCFERVGSLGRRKISEKL